MKRFGAITLLLFWACATLTVAAQDYSLKAFNDKYALVDEDADIVNLCSDFMLHANDMNVLREAQTRWLEIDSAEATQFTQNMSATYPDSAKYTYLLGRVTQDKLRQIELGHKAIQQAPDWPYGYRLVLATYKTALFDGNAGTADQDRLAGKLSQDAPLFDKLVSLDPTMDYPYQFKFAYQVYQKDYPAALATLDSASKLDINWPSRLEYADVYVREGRFDEALKAVQTEMDTRVAEWGWEESEKADNIRGYYSDALRQAGAYDEAIRYAQAQNGGNPDSNALYNVACCYALKGDPELAFANLTTAVKKGWDRLKQTGEDEDLAALHADPRWNKLMADVSANWEQSAPARKAAALKEKLEKDAPDWTLPDVNGNPVNLADLRGNVVVVDFWATWCGPCGLSMPLIDEFTRQHAKPGVKVLSVDVWEKGRRKVKDFMAAHNYAMTLLYGNNDLVKAYEVKGIPTVCVIDKGGKVRYVEIGYSEDLLDKLVWWTEDLLGQ